MKTEFVTVGRFSPNEKSIFGLNAGFFMDDCQKLDAPETIPVGSTMKTHTYFNEYKNHDEFLIFPRYSVRG